MSSSAKTSSVPEPVKAVRRIAIIVIIVALSISALIGIVTLLSGDIFGTVQSNIMFSTLVIGLFGVLALCDLAVAGNRYRLSGYVGIGASSVALIVALLLIWGPDQFATSEVMWKVLGLASIAAISLSHANLLLLLADRRRTAVRLGLWVTVGLIALLAILLALLILTDGEIGDDGYARLVGTVAILDVLGTIVVPVMGAILRDARLESDDVVMSLSIPRDLDARLSNQATATGSTREAFVLAAIAQQLKE